MPTNIAINLRVTCDRAQGDRKYMEDEIQVKFWREKDGDTIEFAFFAVFDGHGGAEASKFAKQHLLDELVKLNGFWTDDDQQITRAIREAFISTHKLMWKVVGTWPRTSSGFPSTAGTTASVAILKGSKLYIAHVGDSTVVMGTQEEDTDAYKATAITEDHKPESPKERQRIEASGGLVIAKAGVPRVVWNRPKNTHEGPVRRSTHIDQVPFLAVARSLGDLWSYNFSRNSFVVSPDPDMAVIDLDPNGNHVLILASDGLWNMISPQEAVNIAVSVDDYNPKALGPRPASVLMRSAINRWAYRSMRADNTSVIVVIMEPPNPGRNGELIKQTSNTSSTETIQLNTDTHPNIFQAPAFKSYSPKRKATNHYVRRDSEIAPSPSLEIVVHTSDSDLMVHKFLNKPALVRSPAKISRPAETVGDSNVSVQYPPSSSSSSQLTSIKPKPSNNGPYIHCYPVVITRAKSPRSLATNLTDEMNTGDGLPPAKLKKVCTKETAGTSVLRTENGSKTNITAPTLKPKWSTDIPQKEQTENLLQPCITRARAAQLSKSCYRVTRRRSANIHNENCVTKPKNLTFSCKLSLRKALKRKLSLNDSILPFRVKRSKTDTFRKVKTRIGRRRSTASRR